MREERMFDSVIVKKTETKVVESVETGAFRTTSYAKMDVRKEWGKTVELKTSGWSWGPQDLRDLSAFCLKAAAVLEAK